MRAWHVVLLLNLALAIGLLVGYGAWGRPLRALETDYRDLQKQVGELERQREASLAGGAPGQQQWEGHGVIRAIHPRLILLSHEEIADLLPARTTGFRVIEASAFSAYHVGDTVRFWLQGTGPDNTILVKLEGE
ncbi:hypothetical protein K32_08780 [Kaistia sp. 32K]|nr:hypothetical protein K32_08780 [Kaistia sp. 32K]